ncbi:hypothetical protein SCLCIDRAFT_337761 [Scleroderma citrinum Foug A]|uniref:Uncharacterized protein n=1 Tax=Scleroderma citrinum Foug A TaxID=1036808 RepID=A0A0C3DEU0_9AGAM|nr:hypothetical protein SCLCIDRAFT_337761 [Scleroderma citrinum Foug A]
MVCCQEVLDLVSSYSDLLGAVVTLLDRSCNLETTCILPSHVATAEVSMMLSNSSSLMGYSYSISSDSRCEDCPSCYMSRLKRSAILCKQGSRLATRRSRLSSSNSPG